MPWKATAFCIMCGESIAFNPENPLCHLCGGVCSAINRASDLDMSATFCHKCGQPTYSSPEKPFCNLCGKELKINQKKAGEGGASHQSL